jgi:hypothetical protein
MYANTTAEYPVLSVGDPEVSRKVVFSGECGGPVVVIGADAAEH